MTNIIKKHNVSGALGVILISGGVISKRRININRFEYTWNSIHPNLDMAKRAIKDLKVYHRGTHSRKERSKPKNQGKNEWTQSEVYKVYKSIKSGKLDTKTVSSILGRDYQSTYQRFYQLKNGKDKFGIGKEDPLNKFGRKKELEAITKPVVTPVREEETNNIVVVEDKPKTISIRKSFLWGAYTKETIKQL